MPWQTLLGEVSRISLSCVIICKIRWEINLRNWTILHLMYLQNIEIWLSKTSCLHQFTVCSWSWYWPVIKMKLLLTLSVILVSKPCVHCGSFVHGWNKISSIVTFKLSKVTMICTLTEHHQKQPFHLAVLIFTPGLSNTNGTSSTVLIIFHCADLFFRTLMGHNHLRSFYLHGLICRSVFSYTDSTSSLRPFYLI